MKNRLYLLAIVFICAIAASQVSATMYHLYDHAGHYLGQTQQDIELTDPSIIAISKSSLLIENGGEYELQAGIYIASPTKIMVPVQSSGFALDFGFLDATSLYFPQDQRNSGDIKTCDLNGDGLEDIIFSMTYCVVQDSIPYRPHIWIQNQDHTFFNETENLISQRGCSSIDIELFDADNDGDVDIFMAGNGSLAENHSSSFYINHDGAYFTEETQSRIPPLTYPEETYTYHASVVDINGDGAEDIFVVIFNGDLYYAEADMQFWINDGNGYFTKDETERLPETDAYGYWDFNFIDIDNDALLDLVFTNWEIVYQDDEGSIIDTLNGHNAVFRNTGDGCFVDETIARMPEPDNPKTREMVFVDIDNDLDTDIIEVGYLFGNYDKQVRLLLNDGQGYFSVVPNAMPDNLNGWFNKTICHDFNADGYLDLFFANVAPGEDAYDILLLSDSTYSFTDHSDLLPVTSDFSVAAAVFDHQADNDIDIVTANSDGDGYYPGLNAFYLNTLYHQSSIDDRQGLPTGNSLLYNYPNPFNSSTSIYYQLDQASDVKIAIYDLTGNLLIETIIQNQPPGTYQYPWQASNCSSGIYFVKVTTATNQLTNKLTLIK